MQYPYESSMDLNIPSDTGFSIVIFGASKSGKSTLIRYLYEKYFRDDLAVVLFSPNSHIKVFRTAENMIKADPSTLNVKRLLELEKTIADSTDPVGKFQILNIFDDVIDVYRDKAINELFLTSRNKNISVLLSLQYPKLLSTSARSNANIFIFGKMNLEKAIKDIVQDFLLDFMKQAFGCRNIPDCVSVYKRITANHGFILLQDDQISLHKLPLGEN